MKQLIQTLLVVALYCSMSTEMSAQTKVDWTKSGGFSEGLAEVSINGKYGFIDKTGKLVIPCQWAEVSVISERLVYVKDDNGEKWLIDITEKTEE